MHKNLFSFFGLAAGLVFSLLIFVSYVSNADEQTAVSKDNKQIVNNTKTPISNTYNLPQKVKSVPLDKEFTFAGEIIPMNIDTRERLDRELLVNSYWQSSTLLNIKMAKKHFPTIERILKEEGVPDDFKYLSVIESGLRNVSSYAGAKGYWQFMKAASSDFGLEVNSEVDERYHLEKSTRAAAKYLKNLNNQFGSWLDAAAAYNMGASNLKSNLKSQNESSYFDLNLGEETSRYVFRMVAMKEILENPEDFGYYIDENQHYDLIENYYEMQITESIPNLGDFAHKYGTTYRLLKYYNPWLIDNKLTVKNNTYLIKIPKA